MNQIELSGVVVRTSEFRETEDGIHAAYVIISFHPKKDIHVMGLHAAADELRDFEQGDGLKVSGKLIWLEGTGIAVLADEVRRWNRRGALAHRVTS